MINLINIDVKDSMITQSTQCLPLIYVMIVPALTADIAMHSYIYIYGYFTMKDGGKRARKAYGYSRNKCGIMK